jgi:hypothetical protein
VELMGKGKGYNSSHVYLLAIMATVVIRPTGKTSDEITGKAENETSQVRTHTWEPGTSPKLKFLQDLSIRVNPEVTKKVVHHAGL